MNYTTLSSEQLYRSDVRLLPKPTTEEEKLLFGVLGYILTVADTYSVLFPEHEYIDLVAVGNLAAVKHASHSLTKICPPSYLRGCIKKEIYWYCVKSRQTYALKEEEAADLPIITQEKDYSKLYEAIGKLPPKSREIVLCHFGLGVPKQSLYELSRQLSPSVKGSYAYLVLYRALEKLRKMLL